MLLAASDSAVVRRRSSGCFVTTQIEPRISSCSRNVTTVRDAMSGSFEARKKGWVSVSIRFATPRRRTSRRNASGTR